MDDILRDLKMAQFVDAFEKEKITPDIVCFLNRNEMLQLGLHPQEMTKLRNVCINYGTKQPTRQISGCGASKFSIPKEILRNFIDDGFSISNIASLLSVSEKTIYRRMQEYNLKKRVYTDIEDREIKEIVRDLIEEFPSCGEIMLGHILQQKNIKIERAKLRLILHEIDKDGINARRSGRLQRRTYQSQGPNHIWHIDSNHKLVRWNFIVSGGIDGFSRMIVFLKCEDNNKADTVSNCFMEGVKDFGIPLRVRTDKGMENSKIADFMIEKRGSSSMLLGKSVHNQRIERLWRDVFNGVLGYYYRLFYFMEEEEILDPLNEVHLLALHYIYLPKINEKLKLWSNAWATHKLRTVKASPWCLWTAGNFNNPVGDDVSDSVDNLLENELNELEGNPRPIFEGLSLLNPLCFEELERRCPATWTSINHGIDKYQICVEVLKNFNV